MGLEFWVATPRMLFLSPLVRAKAARTPIAQRAEGLSKASGRACRLATA